MRLILSVFLFMFLPLLAYSIKQAVIPAVFLFAPPVIDGELNDSCWQEAPSVNDFYDTSKGIPANEPTTAWIAYDDRNIYILNEVPMNFCF